MALDLLPQLYDLLRKLLKSENYLVNQSKRSGTSIPSNIAEGAIAIIAPKLASQPYTLLEAYKVLAKENNKARSVWHFKGITQSDLI